MKNIPIKEIMSTHLKTLHPKDKMKVAKEIFDNYEIHHIPVHVMGEIKGILSLGDVLFLEGLVNNSFDEFVKNKKYEIMTVDEVMTARPYCIDSEATISEALDIMIDERVNALPVKENNELVGIITSYDLLNHLKELINNL